ncbi:hypothetical protein [Pandoravirus japonicus]|uniref:Ankyrin repeat domain containing protein n=1 Tax=Pandoravirus japonicus TaxID=2823154 RepID=A0A811BM03_9VIRU|nr:hypothetical protein [Pandoravirus japonicus]
MYDPSSMDVTALDMDDSGLGLDSLPPEIIEMILRSAGPFAAARAARASRHMAGVAREAAKQENKITAQELCDDYETCLREFLLAAAEDDADTVEYIIASGAIDPRRPLIASVSALPRPPSDPEKGDAYVLLRTAPPSTEGWTPLAAAAAYGAPAVIARLASIGVRPQPTAETLINGLLHRGWQLHFAAPVIRGVKALTGTYPRTSPLDPADQNPLTALREYAVERARVRTGHALNRVPALNPRATDAAFFDTDVLPIAETLLEAGYSPGERAQSAVGEIRHTPSEMDLLVQALRESERPMGALKRLGTVGSLVATRRALIRAVLQGLLDVYEEQGAGAPAGAGSLVRIVPSVDAMEWEGQI